MDSNRINMDYPDHTSTLSEDVTEKFEVVALSPEPEEAVQSVPDKYITTPRSLHVPLPE